MDGRHELAQFIERTTTQAAFARTVRCSEGHLSLVLSGKRDMSFKLAKRVSEASGVPLEALAPAVETEAA